jgi:hypothetical protein
MAYFETFIFQKSIIGWSEEDFITALRTGVTPSGHVLSEAMPWRYVGQMTDEELQAIWLYLQSLPALEQGTERTRFISAGTGTHFRRLKWKQLMKQSTPNDPSLPASG